VRLLAAQDLSAAAGPIGLLVVVLIGLATVLLVRNMDKRLKRMPREFEPPVEEPGAPGQQGPRD